MYCLGLCGCSGLHKLWLQDKGSRRLCNKRSIQPATDSLSMFSVVQRRHRARTVHPSRLLKPLIGGQAPGRVWMGVQKD